MNRYSTPIQRIHDQKIIDSSLALPLDSEMQQYKGPANKNFVIHSQSSLDIPLALFTFVWPM